MTQKAAREMMIDSEKDRRDETGKYQRPYKECPVPLCGAKVKRMDRHLTGVGYKYLAMIRLNWLQCLKKLT